jgi:hypothetical protein
MVTKIALVDRYRNIGSGYDQFIDQTSSQNPALYGGTEWFWTSAPFCGGDAGRQNCASGYSSILNTWGFGF